MQKLESWALFLLLSGCGSGLGDTGAESGSSADSGSGATATSLGNTSGTQGLDTGTSGVGSVDTGDTTITSGGFEPDAGVPDSCDPWAQDCPAGYKCMLCDGGFPGCKPVVDEPDQVGEPCTFIPAQGEEACNDSCVPGAQCWNVDPQTNEGTCWATCTGSAERPVCEDPGTLCLGGASDFADLLCVPLCDPLGQDCPEGEGCYWVSEVYACLVDNSGDGGEPGASCSIVQDCDPGNLCLDPSLAPDLCGPPGLGCCIPFCDIDQGPCPGGEPCTSVYAEDDPIPPGLEHVGICGGG